MPVHLFVLIKKTIPQRKNMEAILSYTMAIKKAGRFN
jgi:hypothetical protein